MKIKTCRIQNSDASKGIWEATVFVTLEGETTEKQIFSHFDDELSFNEAEFVGLTVEQAHALRTKRDIAYIQS